MIKISLLLILVVILLQAVEIRGEDKGKDDSEKLAGVWACVSGVNDGKPLPEDIVKQLKLTLTKDRYKTEKGQVLPQLLKEGSCLAQILGFIASGLLRQEHKSRHCSTNG